jgi:hypothetical protein
MRQRKLSNGNTRVTVDLKPGEKVLVVRAGLYRLPEPVDMVVHSDFLTDAKPVAWCSAGQEFYEVTP